MKIIFSILILFFLYDNGFNQHFYSQNFANTYSIIAVDSITGEIGAAVQSHWFSVGSNVIWAEAGVGAVATQSFINPSFGLDGLKLMNEGRLPQEALSLLVNKDEGRDFRQVALINANGISAAHTGVKCIPEAGHKNGKYFSAQANLMLKASVWPAMVDAFKKTKGPLAERLVASLEAAQKEGGDIRGKQSAAILVVRGIPTGKIWKDRLIEIRVEDHPDPVKELKRLLRVHRAYEHMNAGDVAIETGDEQKALLEYGTAERLQPDNLEMKYWHAVSLVNIGKIEEALPKFNEIFLKDDNWRILTPRLVPLGLLNVNNEDLEKILHLQ